MNIKKESTYIYLIFLAICFLATGGIFVKLSSLPPITTGFYRVLFSLPLLYPFVKGDLSNVSKKDFYLMFFSGVFLALDLVFWNMSFQYTTVANANLLVNLVPLTIIPLSYFFYREKLNKSFFIGLVVLIIGIIILMKGKISTNPQNFRGDFYAFIASIFYGLFLFFVSNIRNRVSAKVIMFICGFGSLITLFIAMFFKEGIGYPVTLKELIPLVGLAIFSQLLGQGLMSYCVGKIRITLSSILVLSQPIVAAVYSFLLFNEKISQQEILGIFIVLIGIYISKKQNS
ncbi:DMT family transporter [uncultured Cetobacterium sp.]|uniref:DMT family transporter n=1 Tax=uncultured Cetobacterium sp. TaxID=527638 RepID=UPI002623207B|nr:DMT family transporter [uncultured Cetobacterium sp.]